ncbi:MAG TPA: YihY/virulence factor BrkB family protein [Elusimicrobiales bacterium]|nr:YihY/virulence factor BrkB family protein [Elusimicrobiales bacterium]
MKRTLPTFDHLATRSLATLRLAADKFIQIDGEQRASAFAYNAFFAMFPLILLTVSIASMFVQRAAAGNAVINFAHKYIPLTGEMQGYIFSTVTNVVRARGKAGSLAFVMLIWAASQFFTTITQATNRAWGTQGRRWWHNPLRDLGLLTLMLTAALIGIAVPIVGEMARGVLYKVYFFPWAYSLWIFFVPWLVLFFSLALFYRFAPHRPTRFSEVWFSAFCATWLLYLAQSLFLFYLRNSTMFNAVYGTFGAIIALMLWIYLSGVIFIFCACLGAAQSATAVHQNG